MGIDAGGSRTRALAARPDGTVVGHGTAGPANVLQLGMERARAAVLAAADEALARGGVSREGGEPLAAVFVGMAGAGAVADQEIMAGLLDLDLRAAKGRCRVDHDMRIALAGAFPGGPGVVLIAGTGSVCFGCGADGRTWRAGGYGPVLDDGGSGTWLGTEALRACVRWGDGRGRETPVVVAVRARLGLATSRDVLRFHREHAADRGKIASLAPLVVEAADGGDAVAAEIVSRGAGELALMVEAVWRGLALAGGEDARLAGVGGLLECESGYRRAVAAAVAERLPGVALQRPRLDACAGAVLLALEAAGAQASAEETLANLSTSAAAVRASGGA